MNNKRESRTKNVFKKVFQISYWSDWKRTKAMNIYILQCLKALFIVKPPKNTNSHDSFLAMQSTLNLSEAELIARQNGLKRLSIIMLVMAAIILGYAIY